MVEYVLNYRRPITYYDYDYRQRLRLRRVLVLPLILALEILMLLLLLLQLLPLILLPVPTNPTTTASTAHLQLLVPRVFSGLQQPHMCRPPAGIPLSLEPASGSIGSGRYE